MTGVFPVKQKTFALHQDGYAFMPDRGVLHREVLSVEEKQLPDAMETIGMSNFQHTDPHKRFFHRIAASFNDPVAVYFVLDALVHSMRGTYLRPLYVCQFLQTSVPQFFWDPTLVGRIIAGIEGACYQAYIYDAPGEFIPDTHGDGTPVSEDDQRCELPFARGRDSKGKYYVIDPRGGDEGLLWLAMARASFYELSTMCLNGEKFGDFEVGRGKSKTPVNWYMKVVGDTARDVQEFNNSRTGRPFPTTRPNQTEMVEFGGS